MYIVASKLFQLFGRPDSLAVILLCLGALLLWTRRFRLGRRLVAGVALFLLLVAVLPLGRALVARLGEQVPPLAVLPAHVDGIITMGGIMASETAATGVPVLGEEADTLTEMLRLARLYPRARLVYTGGTGRLLPGGATEAAAARLFFQSQGLDLARFTFEDRSRTTYQHAALTKALVDPKPGQTWIVITTALRAERQRAAFRAVGWTVVMDPVHRLAPPSWRPGFYPARNLSYLWDGMKEMIGLAVYRLTGRAG